MSTRRTYTREFKIEAVKLLSNSDKSVDTMAETLGVSRSSLNRWQREFGADPDQAFPGNGQRKERDEEVARLQKALREAQMEVEILKKAVAIFTRSQR
jgi:transposase